MAARESNREMEPLKRRHVVEALITTHYRDELRFQGVSLRGADLSKLDLRNINFKVGNGGDVFGYKRCMDRGWWLPSAWIKQVKWFEEC